MDLEKVCVTCGKTYKAKAKNQKYCNWFTCHPSRTKLSHRWRIFERDNFRCIYCGVSSLDEDVTLHLDHVIPVTKGGTNTADNIVTSCKSCNSSKNNRSMNIENENMILAEVKRRNVIFKIQDNMPAGYSKSRK